MGFLLVFLGYLLFPTTWIFFLFGAFIVIRSTLSPFFSVSARNLIAFSFSSSCLFQLLRMYESNALKNKFLVDNGPPISCFSVQWISNLFSRYSCQDYHDSVYSNGFYWQLNVFRVVAELFSDVFRTVFALTGHSLGAFLGTILDELHWSYRIPAFTIFTITLLATIFVISGYEFSFLQGIFRIGPVYNRKNKYDKVVKRNVKERCRINVEDVNIICESYQKLRNSESDISLRNEMKKLRARK